MTFDRNVTPGSLFPALHRLERDGWLTSHWGRRRSVEAELDDELSAWVEMRVDERVRAGEAPAYAAVVRVQGQLDARSHLPAWALERDSMSKSPKSTKVKKIAAVTAGAVAVGGAVAAGAKLWKRKRRTTVVHAEPGGKSWRVRVAGKSPASEAFATKKEAVAAARAMAHDRAPSRLVIHRADGSVQTEHGYEPL